MDAGSTEGNSKFRILTAEDESAQAASEPASSETAPVAKSGPVWRMHNARSAGATPLASRTVESTPDRPATLSVAEGQAAVAFRGSQPAGGVQFADASAAAEGGTVQAGYIAAEGAEAKFAQASWSDATDTSSATPAATTDQVARGGGSNYGYDPSYNSLRGQLEYSQVKAVEAAYIPIDGSTDQYGGSVVLADSPQSSKIQTGRLCERAGLAGGRRPVAGWSLAPL